MHATKMRAMERRHRNRNRHPDKPLAIAYVVSVLIHIVVLSLSVSPPRGSAPQQLKVTIAKTPTPEVVAAPSPERKQPKQKILTAAASQTPSPMTWPVRTWTRAERSEMDNFLNELANEAKPQRGKELAAQAIATARQPEYFPPSEQNPEDTERRSPGPTRKSVDAFSMEMYFDAFLTKLNRSAAFVKKETRKSGYRKALVQILLKPDGTLKSYEVLRSGDQEIEIAYIKSVVDRASPFSAFPRDIAGAAQVLSIFICITPSSADGTGSFSRASPNECRD